MDKESADTPVRDSHACKLLKTALDLPADSPDFKPRVNWSRFHETMPLADMAQDPYATSANALKTNVPGLTSTDGVNGPADISGAPANPPCARQRSPITAVSGAG